MNILIPDSWLREYLKTTATPDQIRTNLSLCGPSVERIYNPDTTPVYDIEVTTNRVDCMSVRGLAREAVVILNQFGLDSQLTDLTADQKLNLAFSTPDNNKLPLPIITDKVGSDLARRVMCAVIAVTPNAPTPTWMAERLEQIEENIHYAAVDITNYITHELGHPCHAFDYDKIMALGGEIIITTAPAGQKFITLDGEEHLTIGGEIVFTNPQGEIIDLPAIKGTANTAIDEQTTRILFWLENLDPQKVRQASMGHAIRTVAATLNEKNVDPYLAEDVFYRGLQLFQELCQGQLISDLYDYFPFAEQNPALSFSVPWTIFPKYLGLDLPQEQIIKILTDLGLGVEVDSEQANLSVTIPSWRSDLAIPADIVEEVARIYGYHHLPSNLGYATSVIPPQPEFNFQLESTLKHSLANAGYQEIYQYSMISEAIAVQGSLPPPRQLKITNDLTADRVYMRTSLLPSLLETYHQNINTQRQIEHLSLFELAQTYWPNQEVDHTEVLKLALLSDQDYRSFRADLETVLAQHFLTNIQVKPLAGAEIPAVVQLNLPGCRQIAALLATDRAGENQTVLGYLYDFVPQNTALLGVELDMNALVNLATTYPGYQALSPYPPLIEDLTFALLSKDRLPVGELINQLQAVNPQLIKSVILKDIYQLPDGQTANYTFTLTYSDRTQPLSSHQIAPLRGQIVAAAEKNPGVKLVGEV